MAASEPVQPWKSLEKTRRKLFAHTVSDSLPAYPCNGSIPLLHVLCTGQACNSGACLLFFSFSASSCFLPSVPHSVLHRFYAPGCKIQYRFFDEKEMAPVVSFIWKEKSPIIEKLVTLKVTLLNAPMRPWAGSRPAFTSGWANPLTPRQTHFQILCLKL